MAVVSPMLVNPQHTNFVRFPGIRIPEIRATRRRGEIVEEPPEQVVEDKIYVAVGKELSECKSILSWTLDNSEGKPICILHVHQPAQRIPLMGTKFSVDQLEEYQVRFHREKERKYMNKILNDYRIFCERAGVRADILPIEMDSVEKGIIELISQLNIRKLVMGAAADKSHSKKMMEPQSKKAIYVRLLAPVSCEILFICKGRLIYTREGRSDGISSQPGSLISTSEVGRSKSATEALNNRLKLISVEPDHRRAKSNVDNVKASAFSTCSSRERTPQSRQNSIGNFSRLELVPAGSPSVNSLFSSCSSGELADDIASTPVDRTEDLLELLTVDGSKDAHQHISPPSMLEGGMIDKLYEQLEQAMAEAESSKREAFEESIRRSKSEKDAIDAFRRAKMLENLYAKELRKRNEIEEALITGKEEIEKMRQQLDEVTDKLRISLEQKTSLENRIVNSDQMVQELEERMFSAVEILQKYKRERDELQVERDNALKLAEELREKQAEEASNAQCCLEFSFSEIEEATRNFDPSMKIGEGGYGSIYKGLLRHTQVAIKMAHCHSMQGPLEFQQEVNVLTKLRHPNLVTLIGSCPEAWILVYEYLPNGSLEDRLSCKDNTPPLSWQTRIRIAAELCSALIFLHSCNSYSIVHGDLKPANILLDAHYGSKLSDFGICRVISGNELSSNNTTPCRITNPKGTLVYIDPEFLQTGELTAQSDVYSFGVILLRLLTGRPALGITKDVQCALDNGSLKDSLDPKAGDWPFVQAKQLAHLAMRCCEMNRKSRPDLVSEVWRVLEPMKASCGVSSFQMGSDEHCKIPPYFICPILQEIMQDPHVAADGFTYELEALKGWLDSGHNTSPMTNLQLPHCNLVPNYALRSAIQEWLHQA